MKHSTLSLARRTAGAAIALSLGLGLAACGSMPGNRSVDSVHQPVVEKVNYTLDVASSAGGLAYGEQKRLASWFEAMNLRYGDRIYLDDPSESSSTRGMVEAIAGKYGILLDGGAPQTEGYIAPGAARVIIARSVAHVPGCPDWDDGSDTNLTNGTSNNYGCATNANLAAMVANPEHLLRGDNASGDTVIMSSSKAIDSYRKAEPTGVKGLSDVSASKEQ